VESRFKNMRVEGGLFQKRKETIRLYDRRTREDNVGMNII
jgi:hypothetical protein